jgi:NAD(P)-dependent dehydrogenase (short-subunit alcohol dehydrogenase family)
MGSLAGRVVAIPGATGSLGPSVARRLVAGGARVSLAGRDTPRLAAIAAELEPLASTAAVDLLDERAVRSWADGLAVEHGTVDAVVHLVGGFRGGAPIEEAPAAEWDELSRPLVLTAQVATRAFTPHLLASGSGRFVLVSSWAAQRPTSGYAAYAAAKAAAETWTLALADRFAGTGSTANIVVTAAFATPEARAEEPDRDFSTLVPAEEIAEAIAYLLSETASAVNGQRIGLRA